MYNDNNLHGSKPLEPLNQIRGTGIFGFRRQILPVILLRPNRKSFVGSIHTRAGQPVFGLVQRSDHLHPLQNKPQRSKLNSLWNIGKYIMFRIDSAAAVTQKMPLDQRRMSYFPILLFVSNALIPYRT